MRVVVLSSVKKKRSPRFVREMLMKMSTYTLILSLFLPVLMMCSRCLSSKNVISLIFLYANIERSHTFAIKSEWMIAKVDLFYDCAK